MRHHATETQFRMMDARFSFMRIGSVPALLLGVTIIWGCTSLPEGQETTPRCPDSVQAKVSAAKQQVHVSYTEPSMTANDTPLTDLLKTNIYYDLGAGRTLAKDVPATQPSGGGEISETITIPITSPQEQSVSICVTAMDRHGNESAVAP